MTPSGIAAQQPLPFEKPRVLIVEDEPTVQQALKRSLKYEGYELFFAENGEQALDLFEEQQPVLVLLDLWMPVMDGFGVLEKLRPQAESPFSVIVITGHGDEVAMQRCYDLGATAFLRKPVSMVEICCLSRRCIDLKQIQAERNRLISELREAVTTIRSIVSFLVICANCKKIRSEEGAWSEIESFFHQHSDIKLSHSICPTCVEKLYPRFYDKKFGGG